MRDPKKAVVDLALARPGDIIGYGKNGKPWYLIAGGSVDAGLDTPGGIIAPGPGIEPPAVPRSPQGTHPSMMQPQEDEPPAAPQTRGNQPTWEDVERARQEEKDKLYPRVDGLEQQLREANEELNRIRQEREERERRKAEREGKAAEEAKKEEEKDLDARTLLERRTMEWEERFRTHEQTLQQEREAREQAEAMLVREREYQDFLQWRSQRIEAERENIAPQLLDLVGGDSPEEVEANIEKMKAKTEELLQEFAAGQAIQQQNAELARRNARGPSVTSPSVGPMDTITEQQEYSPEDIRRMPMAEYAKRRQQLLGAASRSYGQGQGMFG